MRRSLVVLAAMSLSVPLLAEGPSLEFAQAGALREVSQFKEEHESPLATAYNHLFALQGEQRALRRKIESQQIEVRRWVNDLLRAVDDVLSWGAGYVYTPDPKKMAAEEIAKTIFDHRLVLAPSEDEIEKICVFRGRAKKPDENPDQFHRSQETHIFNAQTQLVDLERQMKDVDESIEQTQRLIDRLSRAP